MIKGSIQEEDNAPNIGAPQYIWQTPTGITGEIDSNRIIVGEFNTLFTPMDWTSEERLNKETQTLNETLDQMVYI